MKTKIVKLLIGVILLIFSSCEKSEPIDYIIIGDHKINSDKLEQAFFKAEQVSGLKSLLVSVQDSLVAEQYFTEMGADDLYLVMSVTKSVISTLIGIAIDEGYIESINKKLSDYLIPLGYSLEGEKANITIEHLLTMSAGFEWNEFRDGYSYSSWVRSSDQIEYCIQGALVNTPGERFGYSSEEAHLLSVILTEATGMSTHDFAFKYLFEPIGIGYEDFVWGRFPQGYFNGGSDLYLKPKDMLKLGNLFLNSGLYEGKQIVPSSWVQESTSFQIATNLGGYTPDYGYLFWMNNDTPNRFYCANGYGGQLIVVFPDLELVVVTTSESNLSTSVAGQQWYKVMSLIQNEVLNCVE